jgi:putative transposase
LAVVLALFSRQLIGWSMSSRIDRELAMNVLLMAVWRRQPKNMVTVHSDQFSSYDWRDFLAGHTLQQSMSRRGNCHDNAVAESFVQLLKRERIRRKTYRTREEAKQDFFDYIEMFHNPKRRHSFSNDMSPVEYEKQYFQRLSSAWTTRGDSRSSSSRAPGRLARKWPGRTGSTIKTQGESAPMTPGTLPCARKIML